jgi:tetratricopeptide (TPR) repeat protein
VELHRRIAEREETAWGERAAEIAMELAHHYRKAGETEHAIGYLERAAEQARQRSAYREALENYQHAATLLGGLPQSTDRDARELKLRDSIGDLLVLTKGSSASETIEATEYALELAERCGDSRRRTFLMLARGAQAYDAGDPTAANTIADQVLDIALGDGDVRTLAKVYQLQVQARHSVGDFSGAEKYFAAWLRLFEEPRVRLFPSMAAAVFGAASLNAWTSGRMDIARGREARMLALGRQFGTWDGAYAPAYAAKLRFFMQEFEQAEVLATQALKLTEQYQFRMPGEISRCLLGHAQSQLGRLSEGIALIRLGIDGMLKSRQGIQLPECTAWLAQALGSQGDIVGALNTVEQALQYPIVRYRPEVLRIRGELRLQQGSAELAEADFRDAVTLARSMGAKSLELRATLSLARLLAQQRRRDEARTLLAEIYNWFTEGFDTTDLREAKALLDHLNC